VVRRVYEYFLGKFAASEGKVEGDFYTPKSVVNLIAEMVFIDEFVMNANDPFYKFKTSLEWLYKSMAKGFTFHHLLTPNLDTNH
jgi:hypothetical protein